MSKIDPTATSEHVDLTCRNHPLLRWFTKNIDFIGARSIFFDPKSGPAECACPLSDLVLLSATNTNTNPPSAPSITTEGN